MTKIARPSTHLPPSAREGSPQVPLRSRTKTQPTAEAPESLSLTSPRWEGGQSLQRKRGTPAGREGRVPLSLPAVCRPRLPGGLHPAVPGGWTWALHLPAAPAELRRPVTSTRTALTCRTSSGGLVLQAPGDTCSGTVEDTRVSATRSQRQKPHLGTHTCTAR